jgi:hypothetical protein
MKVSELFEASTKSQVFKVRVRRHPAGLHHNRGTFVLDDLVDGKGGIKGAMMVSYKTEGGVDGIPFDRNDPPSFVSFLIDGKEVPFEEAFAAWKKRGLKEGVATLTRNKKLGFTNKGSKVTTGKQGIPIGGTKEWLKAFGATETDVSQALRVVRQSSEYRACKALGWSDESSDRQNKLGSISLVGYIKYPTSVPGKTRDERQKVTVQANGKIDETSINDHHRAPMNGPKPRIVPGDAVQSIVKTMCASLDRVATTMERRMKQAAAEVKKANGKSYS